MRLSIVLALLLAAACDPVTPTAPTGDPTPAPGDAEALCWDTGGAWEDDACACAQDGATLYHVFDDTLGCVQGDMVAIEALCWDTGGAWENGACECAQDGATLHHIFDLDVGCRAPDAN